jgi:signal transduction histidine kinase
MVAQVVCSGFGAPQQRLERVFQTRGFPMHALATAEAIDRDHRPLGMLFNRFEGPPLRARIAPFNWEGELERPRAIEEATPDQLSERALGKAGLEPEHAARITTLGLLTASVAHEVNQPLAAIVTNGETCLRWLNRAEPDIERARELTKRVIADARRASEIIDRIRTIAKGQVPQFTPLPFNEIIEGSIVFLRHEFQSKDIAVDLDLASDLPRIVGDRIQLQQVVVNLTLNAIQSVSGSTKAGRGILVRTELFSSQVVRCSIEDGGPGIEPNDLPHLFGNFFTTKDSGMGMGLPISQSIIEAHGGWIGADNNSALGGARFAFTLPTNVTD